MDYILRRQIIDNLRTYLERINLNQIIQDNGTPLLVLNTAVIKKQYQLLQTKMPDVTFYYALKAHSHSEIVKSIVGMGGYLDVATQNEIDMALQGGISPDHCMHSHPIKKPAEIDQAYAAGLRLFVVENSSELQKFIGRPDDIRILIRLSFPNSDAKGNLSYKFGADTDTARQLVADALVNNITISGFTMHVGTQIPRADAYTFAINSSVALMDELEATHNITFDTLNIGGGFPVFYRDPVPSIDQLADVINVAIAPIKDKYKILAEPGRFIVAPAGIAVSSVVGVSNRYGMPWYYIDDGVYGNYGNVAWEDTHPVILSESELEHPVGPEQYHSSVIAGPTCDSVDIISKDYLLPELQIGDILVSPAMGAYSTATATTFNSIPHPKTIVINNPDAAELL